jgi:hypothetical protein
MTKASTIQDHEFGSNLSSDNSTSIDGSQWARQQKITGDDPCDFGEEVVSRGQLFGF